MSILVLLCFSPYYLYYSILYVIFFLLLESKLLEEKDAALFIVNPLEYLTQNRPSIFIQLVIYLFIHITKHRC